jgi:nitroimidazol reductase NimA-like FMN-containing flavoprotein (pyridoxamine 5'-phosphate oxidase superfamily)
MRIWQVLTDLSARSGYDDAKGSAGLGVIRNLTETQIEDLLRTAIVGRIACSHPDEPRPYLVPLAYGYDGNAVYAHSGPGRKLTYMRANPLVTIEVDSAEASDRWRSVVAEGRFEELNDSERDRAVRLIYPAPAAIPPLGANTVVFRIVLTSKSGRYEEPE